VGKELVSWLVSWHHHNIFSVSKLVFLVCVLLNSVSNAGLGNEMGKKEGEVGLIVVEWGGGEVASPLL